MKTKEGQEAAEKDAELGLNFTIASNWKNAAKKQISDPENDPPTRAKHKSTFWDAQARQSSTTDQATEAETDRIWRQSAGGTREAPMLVFRGRTANERRELSYAANPGAVNQPYSAQDSRLFFPKSQPRLDPALPPDVLQSTMGAPVPALNLDGVRSQPQPQGSPNPAPVALLPKMSVSNIFAAVPSGSDRQLHQHVTSLGKGGWNTERVATQQGRKSRPVSGRLKSARSASSRAGRGLEGSGFGWGEEEKTTGLQLPQRSFEEAPEEWQAFASQCFMAGNWEMAQRALRALEMGQGVLA